MGRSAKSGGGHGKSETCATGRSWTDSDRAAMCLDNALDDVQAQASATAPVTAPEPCENAADHLRRDTGAFVVDRDGYPAVAVPYRVLKQVGEDLAQLVRVGEDRRGTVRRDDEPVLLLSGCDHS